MKIVSIIKDSFQEVAPFNWGLTLFCFGCNLKCTCCKGYNYEMVTDKNNIVGDAKVLIDKNITPIHDTVVFLGGEPTIHGESLIESLQYCKSKGLKTKIFTNGINSSLVKKINEMELCDSWSVDLKCTSNTIESLGVTNQAYFRPLLRTILNIIKHKLPLEIRTTLHEDNMEDKDKLSEIGNNIINKYKIKSPNTYSKYIIQKDFRQFLK